MVDAFSIFITVMSLSKALVNIFINTNYDFYLWLIIQNTNEMISKDSFSNLKQSFGLPIQVEPFLSKPYLHGHVNEPIVFLQYSLISHLFVAHSSISKNNKYCKYKFRSFKVSSIPSQVVVPFPEYPTLHEQRKDPILLTQLAF